MVSRGRSELPQGPAASKHSSLMAFSNETLRTESGCFIVSCWSLRLCNVWGSSRGLNFSQSWRWCVMSQTIAHEAQMNVNAQTLFFPLEWQRLPENKKQSKTKQTCRSNKCANISLCLGSKWLPEPWFAWRWTIGWTTDPANPCTVFMGVDNGVDNGVS